MGGFQVKICIIFTRLTKKKFESTRKHKGEKIEGFEITAVKLSVCKISKSTLNISIANYLLNLRYC